MCVCVCVPVCSCVSQPHGRHPSSGTLWCVLNEGLEESRSGSEPVPIDGFHRSRAPSPSSIRVKGEAERRFFISDKEARTRPCGTSAALSFHADEQILKSANVAAASLSRDLRPGRRRPRQLDPAFGSPSPWKHVAFRCFKAEFRRNIFLFVHF